VPRSVLLAIALAVLGCASDPARETPRSRAAIQDFAMRARVERVAIGQSAEQAHAILGRDPVERPGHPSEPFPSPLRSLALQTPTGRPLHVELYVVTARAAEGCPDVHVEDAPVVFRDGVVAARSWEAVEADWRSWGGSLAALRDARDTSQCEYPPPAEDDAP
jgi:hypothetical protein